VNALSLALVAGSIGAAIVAIQAGSNLQVAVPVGTLAVLLVSVAGGLELSARTDRLASTRVGVIRQASHERVESDSLLRLRRAFSSGEIGRSSILASVRALERDLSPTGRTPLSLDAERTILNLPPDQLRRWIDDRLRRIEAAT
jgi:hypothetical protein